MLPDASWRSYLCNLVVGNKHTPGPWCFYVSTPVLCQVLCCTGIAWDRASWGHVCGCKTTARMIPARAVGFNSRYSVKWRTHSAFFRRPFTQEQ